MAKIKMQVFGRVQGVSFRYSARQQALSLLLSGWIKNMPDGSILCEATGSKKSLLVFVDWCKHGPQWAEVKNVAVQWLEADDGVQVEGPEQGLPSTVDFRIVR